MEKISGIAIFESSYKIVCDYVITKQNDRHTYISQFRYI